MKKEKYYYRWSDAMLESPVACVIFGIIGIIMGVIMIVSQNSNTPVSREEAIECEGYFESYESGKNYSGINLSDGTYLDIYPHTQSGEFIEQIKSLPKGTKVYALVNPNNEYVAELRTETLELMNFEQSQQDVDDYDNCYIYIGIFAISAAVFIMAYSLGSNSYKKREAAKHSKKKAGGAVRYADVTVKARILLEVSHLGYHICYRRVKHTNELVVNGKVYDEKKGIMEFEHKLCANIKGHNIESGYDKEGYSYITFNGEILERKRRWL